MTEPVLQLDGVTKSFGRGSGRRVALDSVGFDLQPGGTLGIIGPNGSGKTTLLRVIAGVMRPDAGRVVTRGRVGALLEVGAGFHPDLTGVENIFLNGAFVGLGRRETERRLHRIIGMSGLERFMDTPVRHYSSGMVVRLGFAIAAQLEPDLLLLDETFAVGDAEFQARALGRIRELREAGVARILVSHNLDLIGELCERVIRIEGGRIADDGPASRVIAAYRADHARRADATPGPMPPADAAPSVRIASVTPSDGKSAPPSNEPLCIEHTDRLDIIVGFEGEPESLAGLEIEIEFVRDDGRAVAVCREPLPTPVAGSPEERPTLVLCFDPIRLGFGSYRPRCRLVRPARADASERVTLNETDAVRELAIRAPVPPGFRVVAHPEAQWAHSALVRTAE